MMLKQFFRGGLGARVFGGVLLIAVLTAIAFALHWQVYVTRAAVNISEQLSHSALANRFRFSPTPVLRRAP